jgi:hypothetical protein
MEHEPPLPPLPPSPPPRTEIKPISGKDLVFWIVYGLVVLALFWFFAIKLAIYLTGFNGN